MAGCKLYGLQKMIPCAAYDCMNSKLVSLNGGFASKTPTGFDKLESFHRVIRLKL